ncbi:hypothetical protein ACEPPN_018578 [Leptodophora sp. 'Broadleaf-Isolate-01']
MSGFQYQSTFDTTSVVEGGSSSTTETTKYTPGASIDTIKESTSTGDLASFVCHIAYLENSLRNDTATIFFDADSEVFGSKIDIGEGASFRVQRAEWRRKDVGIQSSSENRWGKYVALKAVRPKNEGEKTDWRDVLLEVRALLHEPLRYHPNIVRLIGLGWGQSTDSISIYPQLILEFSEIGSMEALQRNNDPLPFAIKQKLCYDVGRGLSILHACGIVHGDLTHRNVLIYKSKVKTPGLPFTAKLSDFGGSIMDMAINTKHALRMSTWPYSAPELGRSLTEDGIKKTDVYAFGMLIWRTIIDCGNILHAFGLSGEKTSMAENEVLKMKLGPFFLVGAKKSLYAYAGSNSFPEPATVMILHALESTIQHDPNMRDLTRTQWILRGLRVEDLSEILIKVNERNKRDEEAKKSRPPGKHGITADSLGAQLGRQGHDYDPQNNLPGLRPNLSFPEVGEFVFEPLRLKKILDWSQQELIVQEFRRVAAMTPHEAPVELQPHMASFYLFQCHLAEFGLVFNAEEMCHWLSEATEPDDSADTVYYAQAWIWRVCNTFGVQCPKILGDLEMYFKLSIMRGHRTCIYDGEQIIEILHEQDLRAKWRGIIDQGESVFHTMTAGLGMPYFAHRKLRRPYDLDDLSQLDRLIQEELGDDYEGCLKINQALTVVSEQGVQNSEDTPKPRNFESIFVNHIGHGLLHFAASWGKTQALRHMVEKYIVDLNVQDQTASETPMVCACRGGHFESAIYLLDVGASPNASEYGIESPLSWLCSFKGRKMQEIAQRLVDAGADIENGGSHTLRPDVRPISADWEHLMSVSVTPLGRAVIMKNVEAVKILLGHGANPLTRPDRKKSAPGENSVQLAAVLNIPDILEILLLYLNSKPEDQATIFDEGEMLQAAHNASIVPFDTTSLQSRVVRHGRSYKSAMFRTLQLLRSNKSKYAGDWRIAGGQKAPEGSVLCVEVKLGNTDIVEHLIELGHSPNGSPGHRPLEDAVRHNHESIFRVLVGQGANVFIKYSLDNGSQLSLLQCFADRQKTARPSLFIAEYLIQRGIPVDPIPDGAPSAFAVAVRNQDFKLADMLLDNGADVNFTYQLERDVPRMTVLGELVQAHTVRNLMSIEYLLSLGGSPDASLSQSIEPAETLLGHLNLSSNERSRQSADFIVDKTNNLSILHIIAQCSAETINNTAQLSARIIDIILKRFKSDDQINLRHPIYGTALCVASVTSNLHMVSALLEQNARTDIAAVPSRFAANMSAKLGQIVEPATPRNLAFSVLASLSTEIQAATQGGATLARSSLRAIRDNLTILEMLPNPDDPNTSSAIWAQLREKFEQLAGRSNKAKAQWVTGEGSLPVDLSTLKEFDELPWKEGEEMGSEQATQTLLKYLR